MKESPSGSSLIKNLNMLLNNNPVIVCIVFIMLFTSCTSKIEGLWEIEKVKVGDKEMTPIARWVRLNPDKSQKSGNGWFQHSIGTWN